MENIAAIDLKKKYPDDIFFYNKNIEVDFFIPKEHRVIQVSHNVMDEITRQREIKALLKLSEIHNLEQLEIVTYDEEATIRKNGLTIQIVPVWKWVLKT
ncbi:hypothetical protein FACS189474_0730 [Bacteroidia bacterium]|nr:hypothetical protein FACS189474_0730 [Bacteroidia bacterium]